MTYELSKRSKDRLSGVHPDLVKVVERAIEITDMDFTVLEGVRSKARQAQLFASGASQTLNGRHITGHAVDLGAYVAGQVRWDWPLYYKLAATMKQAAKDVGVNIVWGGDWKGFPDGPHFELPREEYPA
jgi:peptidoglycan L-alanyl-D-glutamate endopeptidase CwlK